MKFGDFALDRVSRDQADVATLFKHLRFAGVLPVLLRESVRLLSKRTKQMKL
ncbi:hypothetical protein V1279_001247 [Bradyrhizobium sp. AZCC 1610]|uniref:hypothetical protein n=1 Tax=Bradyrhizobium sp. AZCC 1610 TaxID=3117020 RepID=UPI002FEF82E9